MVKLYNPVQALVKSTVSLLDNDIWKQLLDSLVEMVKYEENRSILFNRLVYNVFLSYNFYGSIPGSSCYLAGYKASKPIALILGFSADLIA